nr:HrpE/YscL family type III secretion apparatus protein [uncultured Limnobacter sp.]
MLKLFRRISFPGHIHVPGPVIKGRMILCAGDHDQIIDFAREEAARILSQAKQDADRIREEARQQTSLEVRNDLNQLHQINGHFQKHVISQMSTWCVAICTAAIEQFIETKDEQSKVRNLVDALLKKQKGQRKISLQVHPAQINMVHDVICERLGDLQGARQWEIIPNHELQIHELKIVAINGAETSVSIANLLAMYREEIQVISRELQPDAMYQGNHHEETN